MQRLPLHPICTSHALFHFEGHQETRTVDFTRCKLHSYSTLGNLTCRHKRLLELYLCVVLPVQTSRPLAPARCACVLMVMRDDEAPDRLAHVNDSTVFKSLLDPQTKLLAKQLYSASSQARQHLLSRLYGPYGDPFAVFTAPTGWKPKKSPHTHVYHELIMLLLNLTAASMVVEVGSYIGGSSERLAVAIKQHALGSVRDAAGLLCIDPFVGDLTMWTNIMGPPRSGQHIDHPRATINPSHEHWLLMKGGHPRLYEQWMINIAGAGLQNIALPMAATSTVGLKAIGQLQRYQGPEALKGIRERERLPQIDLLFLDASHEEDETYIELELAWRILAPTGILFGDDFNLFWPGVTKAVRRFALAHQDELANQSLMSLQRLPSEPRQKASDWTQPVPGLVVEHPQDSSHRVAHWIIFKRPRPRVRRRHTRMSTGQNTSHRSGMLFAPPPSAAPMRPPLTGTHGGMVIQHASVL